VLSISPWARECLYLGEAAIELGGIVFKLGNVCNQLWYSLLFLFPELTLLENITQHFNRIVAGFVASMRFGLYCGAFLPQIASFCAAAF